MIHTEMKTKRLVLRPVCLSDISTVHEYIGDAKVNRYMCHRSETLKDTERFLQAAVSEWNKPFPAFFEFAIIFNGTHIGGTSVYLDEAGAIGELGYIINRKYWGSGIATEAAQAVLEFSKNTLHLKRLIAHCDYRNAASARVMEKLGMIMQDNTGVRPYTEDGQPVYELTYSMLL